MARPNNLGQEKKTFDNPLIRDPKLPNLGNLGNTGDKGDAGMIESTNISTFDPDRVNELLLPSYNQNIKVFTFQNKTTGRNTLLIDRNQFDSLNSSNVLIPNVRLSAQPTKMTTNSNLYSEIKISFKTV